MTFYMAITNFGILHNLNLQTASYITIFLFAKQTILIYKLHNHHEKITVRQHYISPERPDKALRTILSPNMSAEARQRYLQTMR